MWFLLLRFNLIRDKSIGVIAFLVFVKVMVNLTEYVQFLLVLGAFYGIKKLSVERRMQK